MTIETLPWQRQLNTSAFPEATFTLYSPMGASEQSSSVDALLLSVENSVASWPMLLLAQIPPTRMLHTSGKVTDMSILNPFVVVECPPTGDAAFASRWLLAAVEADFALTRYRSANPDFEPEIERLRWLYEVEFSAAAMAFTRLWLQNGCAFHLNLAQSEWSDPFTFMANIGFFKKVGRYYQMSHPGSFSPEAIARTLLLLAGTEDDEWVHHPELMVTTMTGRDARRCVRTIKRDANEQRNKPLMQTLQWSAREMLEGIPF